MLHLKIKVVGLKKNDKHRTNDLIDSDLNVINIDRMSNVFHYLTRMQDEVHRYAISTHRNKRTKGITSSFLDEIKGLGKRRLESLLKAYPTKEDLIKASVEELQTIVPLNIVLEIKNKLNK